LLARVEEISARTPADALGPAHGAFRPAQVLLHGDEVGFIDFDGFCRAEPALDIALFTSAVRDIGMEDGSGAALDRWAQVNEICDAFVRRYESLARLSRTRLVLWETLGLFTYVLNCWSKVQPERLGYRIDNLERHLRASGLLTQSAASAQD
jgi:Ser/Thr protein kinase RdoA (MazF antagonist)